MQIRPMQAIHILRKLLVTMRMQVSPSQHCLLSIPAAINHHRPQLLVLRRPRRLLEFASWTCFIGVSVL